MEMTIYIPLMLTVTEFSPESANFGHWKLACGEGLNSFLLIHFHEEGEILHTASPKAGYCQK